MLFDSHCHLADEMLASQWDAVLQRAHDANVSAILNVADTLESARFIQQQLKNNSYGIEVYATAGVHRSARPNGMMMASPQQLK